MSDTISRSPKRPAEIRLGGLPIGLRPLVVGTISTPAGLKRWAGRTTMPCDLVEVRIDRIGAEANWLTACRALETNGYPVIVTVRADWEGGGWTGGDEPRREVFLKALPHCSAIDIEFRSPLLPELARVAWAVEKAVIISYHDFAGTPSVRELRGIIAACVAYPTAVAKIATMVRGERDLKTLRALLVSPPARPLCVIGMGDRGRVTRRLFPALGSCFTYGYLDAPVAPGQISAAELRKQFAARGKRSGPRKRSPR